MTRLYQQAAQSLRTNDDQWAAYESQSHCVLLAGPGSGKTKTLTVKMARMLHEDVTAPRGIACITYSRECARELTKRLGDLGVSDQRNVFIGTVHSFCFNNVLVPYAQIAGLDLPYPLKIATDKVQRQVMTEVAQPYVQRGIRQSEIQRAVDLLRVTQVNRRHPDWDPQQNEIAALALAYEAGLRQVGCIDYTDQVILGLSLVERHEWVRKLLKAKFPILVVDEYQDLGVPLDRLVRRLCFEAGVRLFAVGDPDQTIYGFTGADPGLLERLADEPEVESIRLRTNYRCGEAIVRASTLALGQDRDYRVPAGTPLGKIDVHHLKDGIAHQALHICEVLIPQALDAGLAPESIAVLYPTKDQGDKIARYLDESDYPYIRIDKNAPYDRTPLTRWLEDCAAWCAGGWKTGAPSMDGLLRVWAEFSEAEVGAQRSPKEHQLTRFLWSNRVPDEQLITWLNNIETVCLNGLFALRPELEEELEAYRKLKRAAAAQGKLAHFTVSLFACQGGAPNHLNLSTLHSAKGLEFDMVVMLGMDQGLIPWLSGTREAWEEHRRLFYVGVTRAKRHLHFTYSGWTPNRYGGRRMTGPSVFLKEIREELVSSRDASD